MAGGTLPGSYRIILAALPLEYNRGAADHRRAPLSHRDRAVMIVACGEGQLLIAGVFLGVVVLPDNIAYHTVAQHRLVPASSILISRSTAARRREMRAAW